MRRRLGLALGGGGVKGLAHIGVLAILEEYGLKPYAIAGTSAGALVGGFYAYGMSPWELTYLAAKTKMKDILRPVLPKEGLFDTSKLVEFVHKATSNATFDDLKIPFWCVACDIRTGEQVHAKEGDLGLAVGASCAIPGIFTPVLWEGRLLVDGGVVNNVPVTVARAMGADVVVAVDLNSYASERPSPKGILQTLLWTLEIMQAENARREVATADIVIRPDLSGLSIVNLDQYMEYISRGRSAALAVIPELQNLMSADV